MLQKNKGFTILEIMIMTAIIAILSLMAYPFYKNYMHRVRIIEVINDLNPLVNSLREMVTTEDILPGYKESFDKYADYKDNNFYRFDSKESIQKALGIDPKYIRYMTVDIPASYSSGLI